MIWNLVSSVTLMYRLCTCKRVASQRWRNIYHHDWLYPPKNVHYGVTLGISAVRLSVVNWYNWVYEFKRPRNHVISLWLGVVSCLFKTAYLHNLWKSSTLCASHACAQHIPTLNRSTSCTHLQCFDAGIYLQMNEKWVRVLITMWSCQSIVYVCCCVWYGLKAKCLICGSQWDIPRWYIYVLENGGPSCALWQLCNIELIACWRKNGYCKWYLMFICLHVLWVCFTAS